MVVVMCVSSFYPFFLDCMIDRDSGELPSESTTFGTT